MSNVSVNIQDIKSLTRTHQGFYSNCWAYASARMILRFFKKIIPQLNIKNKENCNNFYDLTAFYLNQDKISSILCGDIEYINIVVFIFIVLYLDIITRRNYEIHPYDPLNKDPKHPSSNRKSIVFLTFESITLFLYQISTKTLKIKKVSNFFNPTNIQLLTNFFNNSDLIKMMSFKNAPPERALDFSSDEESIINNNYELTISFINNNPSYLENRCKIVKSLLDNGAYIYVSFDISKINPFKKLYNRSSTTTHTHSMVIIGYIMKNDKCYYIVKNTWGELIEYFTILDEFFFQQEPFIIFINTLVEKQIIININLIIPSRKSILKVPLLDVPILKNPELSEIPPPIIIDALEARDNLNENNDIIINLNGKKCPNGYIKSKIDKTKCIKKNINHKNKIFSFIKSKKNLSKQDNINIIGNKSEQKKILSFIKSDDIILNKSKTKKNKNISPPSPPKQQNIINLNGKKCPTGYTRHKTDKTKCVSKRNR